MTTPTPPSPPVLDFAHIGPTVGSRFPDIVLPNQDGALLDLHTVRAGRQAVVVFYRSAAW